MVFDGAGFQRPRCSGALIPKEAWSLDESSDMESRPNSRKSTCENRRTVYNPSPRFVVTIHHEEVNLCPAR